MRPKIFLTFTAAAIAALSSPAAAQSRFTITAQQAQPILPSQSAVVVYTTVPAQTVVVPNTDNQYYYQPQYYYQNPGGYYDSRDTRDWRLERDLYKAADLFSLAAEGVRILRDDNYYGGYGYSGRGGYIPNPGFRRF